MKKYLTAHRGFLHGCDYNPEQWLRYPEILEQDIQFMKDSHCNVMSVGIFSWSFLEPEEGVYNFGYFDEIIKNLTENGIKIILATPSGARPRWLAEKYPEVLRVMPDNVKQIYGFRHNHCYTSPIYREKVANINRRLAERYKDNPDIILWHISNEYGGECHCELCQQAFIEYLKRKYNNDLDELNHAWWTGFWSHTVTEWNQIHSPVANGEPNVIMTGLYYDWKEFVTYQTTDFMRHEINSVKAVTPDIPVTANFMGPYQPLDYHYMRNFVDVISWDSYPEWHSARGNDLEAYTSAFAHDLHRGLKNAPFLLMESTPSLTNWQKISKLKRPGMHKLSAMQAVAHGSDSVQYFQWRKGRGGSEQFHGAVIDHNGKNSGRVFEDVKNVGITLEKITEIAGSTVKSEVAVVYDFTNKWALDNSSAFINHEERHYNATCKNHYKEFWKRGINTDVISINDDFSKYKAVILPMQFKISEKSVQKIAEYVQNGGTVVSTYITGYVNETCLCHLGGFPAGRLKEVFGFVNNEIDTLCKGETNSAKMGDKSYTLYDYCELIEPATAEVMAVYEKDFYKDMPVVLKNKYDNGTAYYIAARDTGELLSDFYGKLIADLEIPYYNLPCGTTVHTRENEEAKYIFVENYTETEQAVNLKAEYTDMESGEKTSERIILPPFGVKILKQPLG